MPPLSVANVSAVVSAVRASSFAEESDALLFWLRNDGIAIAARMPMIRITTRSSIRVKPPSSLERWRSRYSIRSSLGSGYRAPALGRRLTVATRFPNREPSALLRTYRCCHRTSALACRPRDRRELVGPLADPAIWTDHSHREAARVWRRTHRPGEAIKQALPRKAEEAALGRPLWLLHCCCCDYQTLFWQPPPSEPVLPAGVHVRSTSPFAFFSIENVWPSVAFAVTTYSPAAGTFTSDR